MAIFAIIENQIIVNVIVAETQTIADSIVNPKIAIDLGNNDKRVGIGWTYENNNFLPPFVETPTTPPVNNSLGIPKD